MQYNASRPGVRRLRAALDLAPVHHRSTILKWAQPAHSLAGSFWGYSRSPPLLTSSPPKPLPTTTSPPQKTNPSTPSANLSPKPTPAATNPPKPTSPPAAPPAPKPLPTQKNSSKTFPIQNKPAKPIPSGTMASIKQPSPATPTAPALSNNARLKSSPIQKPITISRKTSSSGITRPIGPPKTASANSMHPLSKAAFFGATRSLPQPTLFPTKSPRSKPSSFSRAQP